MRELGEARDARALGRLQERYGKVVLLIVDELGFVPFDKHEGELLFNLLADPYERRSIILTSNLPCGEWVSVFENEKLTTVPLGAYPCNHSASLDATWWASRGGTALPTCTYCCVRLPRNR